jgi:hypothetical protein
VCLEIFTDTVHSQRTEAYRKGGYSIYEMASKSDEWNRKGGPPITPSELKNVATDRLQLKSAIGAEAPSPAHVHPNRSSIFLTAYLPESGVTALMLVRLYLSPPAAPAAVSSRSLTGRFPRMILLPLSA